MCNSEPGNHSLHHKLFDIIARKVNLWNLFVLTNFNANFHYPESIFTRLGHRASG